MSADVLTDAEWAELGGLLDDAPTRAGPGRPRTTDTRSIAMAVLYRHFHSHGAAYRAFGWNQLPRRFGVSPSTANRRFREWTADGRWPTFVNALLRRRARERGDAPRPVHPPGDLLRQFARAYRAFNDTFFDRVLPAEVAITVENTGGRCHGYFAGRRWHRSGTYLGQITVGHAALGHGPEVALAVLLHEMVHMRNRTVGLPDANPANQYHSRNFRDVAVVSGLVCGPRSPRHGYAATSLSVDGRRAVRRLRPDAAVFSWSVRVR